MRIVMCVSCEYILQRLWLRVFLFDGIVFENLTHADSHSTVLFNSVVLATCISMSAMVQVAFPYLNDMWLAEAAMAAAAWALAPPVGCFLVLSFEKTPSPACPWEHAQSQSEVSSSGGSTLASALH